MHTVFMNSKNTGTFDPHRRLLNLTDRINLKRSDKYVALSNLSIYYTWKNIKNPYKNLKYSTWTKDFELPDAPLKARYYLKLLMPETMKLFRSTKSKITKDKNGENVSYFEITEVVLVLCSIVKSDYQQESRILYGFVPNKFSGQLSSFHDLFIQTFYIFKNI